MMKRVHSLLALVGLVAAMEPVVTKYDHKRANVLRGEKQKPLPPLIKHRPTNEQMRRKGLKEFNINGKFVWAINEKNAIRKAAKL